MTKNKQWIRERYRRSIEVPYAEAPPVVAAEHTMGSSVDAYALQRLPVDLLDLALDRGLTFELHGVHPDHLPLLMPAVRLVHPGHWFGYGKEFNLVRPRLFVLDEAADERRPLGRDARLIMAVPAGRDYVLHNARILRQYLSLRGAPLETLAKVVRYPEAESSIAEWTGLGDFVGRGDRLLIGYVKELLPHLLLHGATVLREQHSPHYGVVQLELPGCSRLTLLGVRFSFWGCISARLAEACARLGAAEIVYVGKLGTLGAPSEIYQRIFCPTSYLDLGASPLLLSAEAAPPNQLAREFPEIDSGRHMSVATVLEEDIEQRALANRYEVASIDNEIAQIARAAADVAAETGHRMAFSAAHFATDYLRGPGESEHPGIFNLTNHRIDQAVQLKQQMITEIADLLCRYYKSSELDPTLSA